jgi:hypothetical protein
VAVQRWERGKRVTSVDRPANAYLPPSIEERRDGWGKAAGKTPSISWVHPRYDTLLRRERGRRGTPRKMGARGFFGLLGAEVAPRLLEHGYRETRYGDPAAPIESDALSPTQAEKLDRFRRYATHLKDDRVSPDLLAVLGEIRRERAIGRRRQRARALLGALERNWDRLYAEHLSATAVYSSGTWQPAGEIPATWLGWAADEPWLTNELGKLRPPNQLAVRTRITEAIYGDDRSRFAAELSSEEGGLASVRALGIETDPEVDEMLEQLATLRQDSANADAATVELRYAAISVACGSGELGPDEMVGNVTVRRLRRRFGTRQSKEGLVFAGGAWLPPARVFSGAPIFGNRRPFVSGSQAEPLWRALKIAPPTLAACLDVLEELARDEHEASDDEVVINTYLYLESLLAQASSRVVARLSRLPLWNGSSWTRARPIHLVDDEELAAELAERVSIWRLGISPATVPQLVAAVGAQTLSGDMFTAIVHESAYIAGANIERRFRRAVALLRDWLTRRDPKLYNAHEVSWDQLAQARLAVEAQLQLELTLGRRGPVLVPARAHLMREPLTLYVADSEAVGDEDVGGRAIASLFRGDKDKLALAWRSAWERAAHDDRSGVVLAEEATDTRAIQDLFEQAKEVRGTPKRKSGKPAATAAGGRPQPDGQRPARRLKSMEQLTDPQVVLVVSAGEERRDGETKRRGLLEEIPPGRSIDASERPAPQSAPLAYSPEEKERRALEALQIAINGEAAELADYRHLRGVGADALDKLRRFFEIKSTYGPLPDEITLTANEAERAFREGDRFFLVVVGGLEVGYETVVKVIPNPLRSLRVKPTTSVTLEGITKGAGSALEVRFGSAAGRANS